MLSAAVAAIVTALPDTVALVAGAVIVTDPDGEADYAHLPGRAGGTLRGDFGGIGRHGCSSIADSTAGESAN